MVYDVGGPVGGWPYASLFPEDWERFSLYSLAQWTNGMAFRNFDFSSQGRPVIKIAEIKNGITPQTALTDAEYDEAYFVTEGDMLFSWSGQPETSIDAFWWHGPDGWLNQHIFKVLADEETCTQGFLYYLLKYLNPNLVAIARNKQTTGLGHVTRRDLEALEVALPPKPLQKAIAYILGTLDDKVELNRRMNETLEAMARAIFKSWFMDFDPVRAKAAGRQPAGLAPEIADLFPDEFEESELGEVPNGWGTGVLEDLLVLQRGFDLPTQDRVCGPFQVIAASGPSTYHSEAKVKGPGVVTGRSGILGKVFLVQDDFWPLNTTLWVKDFRRSGPYHAYFFLRSLDLARFNAGSAVPTLNRNHVHNLPVVLPNPRVLDCFESTAARVFTSMKANDEESGTLAILRDTLLPKLISGELWVPDAERLVKENAKWTTSTRT